MTREKGQVVIGNIQLREEIDWYTDILECEKDSSKWCKGSFMGFFVK